MIGKKEEKKKKVKKKVCDKAKLKKRWSGGAIRVLNNVPKNHATRLYIPLYIWVLNKKHLSNPISLYIWVIGYM